jgi:uncharacterized SAM-binding protein YcdF (DUF218 family)
MRFRRAAGRWLNRLLAAIGLITVLVISTPVVAWWVRAYSGPIERPTGDILILLSAVPDQEGSISFSSYWRARYALLAWRTGNFKKILVSGGGPGIANFLVAEGIPQEVIVAEWRSTSTHESGVAMARLIQTHPGRIVLVTSDYHMYRAVRVFRKCGVPVSPMSVPDVLLLAGSWNGRFPAFETMLIESTKIAYYSLRGWM